MSQRIVIDLPLEFIRLCHGDGVEPDVVLRGFIADLCHLGSSQSHPREDGYHSHGSEERDMASDYYHQVGYPYWGRSPIQ